MNANLENYIQLIEGLLNRTDGDPDLQSHILGKLGILYEYSVEKNLAIDNILSLQEEIDKLKVQSTNRTEGCYTGISSDYDSSPGSPERQFKSKSSSHEGERKKAKQSKCDRRRSSSKHNEHYKWHSRPGSRGRRHRTSHRKRDENRYKNMKRYDSSDTEKYGSSEDQASYSNSQDRHRTSRIDYKIKNKYRRSAKSSSSHRDNEKIIISSYSDSSDSRYTARRRIKPSLSANKLSRRKTDKLKRANMRDQLANILKSIINKQNTPSSKVEVSSIQTTGKNASMLSDHSPKKEMIEVSTVRSIAKPKVEWVDSFDIELAEEINLEIEEEMDNKIVKMDNEIDDEIIQKVIAESSDSKNEASFNKVVPKLSFDVEVVKQALATAKMYENQQALATATLYENQQATATMYENQQATARMYEKLYNAEPSIVVKHLVKLPFTQSNDPHVSNDPRLHRLRVRDQRASPSLQVPIFSLPPTQPSNYYSPSIRESISTSNERSFYPTESLQSTSVQDHLSCGSLQPTIQSPTVTSPTYSSWYNKPSGRRDKPQSNKLELREYERSKMNKEFFDVYSPIVSFKNNETQMTNDEYRRKQDASIASAGRNLINETGPSNNDNNTTFSSHRYQRVNYPIYGGHRRSQEVTSTSKNAITETVTRPSNTTHPRFGNISRSSKVNFEVQNSAREDDVLAEIHTTDSVEKKSNLKQAKGSEDSKSQKRVNIKQNKSRCNKNNSNLADVNRNTCYNKYKQNLETILLSTPLSSDRNRSNVSDSNSKPVPKLNFKIPKKAISKTLELNEADDWDFEAETTNGSDANNPNITETNNNDRLTVKNTEPQTSASTSKLSESTRTTASEKENNVTSTSSSVDLKENRDIITAVKDLIDPNDFRTIIDLIKKINKHNSLAKVVEAIAKEPNHTAAEGTERLYTSVDAKNTSVSKAKKRKNELDRLNEDIDTMFIRDGVLNATGRRYESAAKKITKRNKSVDDFDIGNRVSEKTNSLLRPRSKTVLLKPKIQHGQHHQPSLPELKSTALQHEKTKRSFAKKSTAKSSQPLEKEKRASHVVADRQDDPKKAKVVSKIHIKNDNPEWHSLKKVINCHLCDVPPGLSLVSHYVNFHPNDEVGISRLAPDVADQLRRSTEVKQVERVKLPGKLIYELKQFCYFCNAYKCVSRQVWINHMAKHTGYYQYECTICSRKFSEKNLNHICGGQKSLRKIPQPHFQKENLYAYICDICNFVRFSEDEIKTHISSQHESMAENEFFEKVMFLGLQKRKKKIENESECDEDYTTECEINSETDFEEKSKEESDGDYEWELDEKEAKKLERKYKEEQRKELEEEEYLEELLATQATESSSEEESDENSEDDLIQHKEKFESVTGSETNTKALESTEENNEKLIASEANNDEAEGETEQEQILTEKNMGCRIEPYKSQQNLENVLLEKTIMEATESTEIIIEQLIVSEANNENVEPSNEEMEQEPIVTEGTKELEVTMEPLYDSPPTPSSDTIVISDDDEPLHDSPPTNTIVISDDGDDG